LWDELCQVCASNIETDGDLVVIKHLYIERRMIPLNMYVQNANSSELHDVIRDYGASLKQMAAANIFPGDMLFKNFGVTQHGRIVFYDYDEICYMTECNFRRIPPPRYPEDEMAAEPWYSVAPNDVFPEEFATFLLVNSKIRKFFEEYHEELLYPEWWQEKQASIRSGVLEDVFPYPENIRFPRP
jgi:isocitrate dehydrogenase kinase/phosphatase